MIISNAKDTIIPLKEIKEVYKKWKESTTHSPSGRHLGHHHALLVPDGKQYDKDKINFSDTM